MSDEIATITQELTTREGFRAYIGKMAAMCADMVPLDLSPERVKQTGQRMAANIAALSAKTPDLRQCSAQSLAVAVAECAALDLLPTTHRFSPVYLIPRRSKARGWEVSAQISSRGMALLAQREGWTISAQVVYEGEHFRLIGGLDPSIEHEPNPAGHVPEWRELSNVVGAYAVAQKPGCVSVFRWLPRAGILKRRAASDSFGYDLKDKRTPDAWNAGIWLKWPEEMILKTAIAYGLSRGMIPMGDHLTYALLQDEAETITVEAVTVPRRAAPDPLGILDRPAQQIEQTADEPSGDTTPTEPTAADLLAECEAIEARNGWDAGQVAQARKAVGLVGPSDTWSAKMLAKYRDQLED